MTWLAPLDVVMSAGGQARINGAALLVADPVIQLTVTGGPPTQGDFRWGSASRRVAPEAGEPARPREEILEKALITIRHGRNSLVN
jgi:hypothetical protein